MVNKTKTYSKNKSTILFWKAFKFRTFTINFYQILAEVFSYSIVIKVTNII